MIVALTVSGCRAAYEGTKLDGEAPDFGLVDQYGSVVRLSDFQGSVVVLAFMDSKCEDACPLTAAQIREVFNELRPAERSEIVFIGVNVNAAANSVADVNEISQHWRLDEVPSWRFLTGSAPELQRVWKEYHIAVEPSIDPGGDELLHTPGIYLIDAAGMKRWYISTPFSSTGSAEWTSPLSELVVRHVRGILAEKRR